MATKKLTFKCSFTAMGGMEYTRYIEAPNGSIALDIMLGMLKLTTRQIRKETVRCNELAPTIWN